MLIFQRNPVEVAAAVNTVLVALGLILGWDPQVTGSLVAAATALAAVVQTLNVFGTDQFTAAAVGFVSTILTLLVAFQVNLTDSVQTALLAIVPTVLGLFARNGVTNKNTPAGKAASRTIGLTSIGDVHIVTTADNGFNVNASDGAVTSAKMGRDINGYVGVVFDDRSENITDTLRRRDEGDSTVPA